MDQQILERLRKEFLFVGEEKISGHTAMKIIENTIQDFLHRQKYEEEKQSKYDK